MKTVGTAVSCVKMEVEKCKWKYGKQAPVMFMIDDFANKYMADKLDGDYVGADWGGRCRQPHSLYEFLQKKIFSDFPYVKMTLFLVVGRREAFIANGKPSVSRRIDETPEFADFLREITEDERFEVAYHGYTHGKLQEDYLTQEWITFTSLEEACQTIEKSKKLYHRVTGKKFYGGKYCGYEFNEFSDASISKSGFEWWCRHWDGNIYIHRSAGVENLNIEEFSGCVDIPSTVDGGLLSLLNIQKFISRNYLRAIYYLFKYGLTIERILDRLVQNGMVVNIQEHSSPIREDEKHQSPNVVDDISNIRYILRYLKRYDLWYATGHEIAEYWKTYQNTTVLLDGNWVVVAVEKTELVGKSIWIALRWSNKKESKKGKYLLRSEIGTDIEGTNYNDKIIFEIKLKQNRERFKLI